MQQNTELHRVLLEMKARCSVGAFQKKQQFVAVFSDLAPQLTMDKQLLGIAIDMGVPAMYAGKTVKDLDMINGRVQRTLGDFMREDAVQLVQQAFALVYFVETAERPKPVPAEQQPIPKPAQKPATTMDREVTDTKLEIMYAGIKRARTIFFSSSVSVEALATSLSTR